MDAILLKADEVAHARWKVKMITHLLEAHGASPWKSRQEWWLQHAEFLHQLATAEEQLAMSQGAKAAPYVSKDVWPEGRASTPNEYA